MIDKSPIIAVAVSVLTTQISERTSSEERSSGTNFEWVKIVALDQLLYQMTQAIELLVQLHCCGKSYFSCIQLPHKIFSWSLQDCLARRQFELDWLRVLQKVLTPACIEEKKIRVDYQEILRYVQTFLYRFKQRGNKQQLDTLELLREIQAFEVIDKTLKRELNENKAICREIRQEFKESKTVSGSLDAFFNINDDNDFSNIYIEFVRNNYLTEFEKTRCHQEELKCEVTEAKLYSQLDQCEMLFKDEDLRSSNNLAALRNEISNFKGRIEIMNDKYAEDFDTVYNEHIKIKFQLDRLNESFKFKTEELQRFHKELEEDRLRVLKMAEIEAERLALLEAEKLAASLRKGKRKRKPKRKPGLSGKQKKV